MKGTGSHKQRIALTVSLDGIKLFDDKSKELISAHPIPLIRYVDGHVLEVVVAVLMVLSFSL